MSVLKRLFRFFTTLTPIKLAILVSLFFATIHIYNDFKLLQTFELRMLDFKFRQRGPRPPSDKIVIVTVDEKTYQTMGKWPYPRSVMADMLNKLRGYGAKVIAFDAMFTADDTNPGYDALVKLDKYYKSLPEKKKSLDVYEKINQALLASNSDWKFVEAIKKTNNVVLGYTWMFNKEELVDDKYDFHNELPLLENSQIKLVYEQENTPLILPHMEAKGVIVNIPDISNASPYNGYFNAYTDIDGHFRKVRLVTYNNGSYYPALSLLAAARYFDSEISLFFDPLGVQTISIIDKVNIPTNEIGVLAVNYKGPSKTYPHYSLSDLLDNNKTIEAHKRIGYDLKEEIVSKVDAFKDKIVIFGVTAIGIFDLRNTPFEEIYPGVEIHANAIDNIISNDFLKSGTDIDALVTLFLIVAGLLFGWLLSKLPALHGIFLTLIIGFLYIYIDVHYIFGNGILVSLFLPLLQILTLYIAITVYKHMSEEKQKKQIKNAFQQYVSASIVQEMLKDPTKLKLGGEKKKLTVMFSDVRGFTTISEKLDAQALSQFLNGYLTPMTDIVIQNGGTIDKYMGDAIMAFYGAPVHQDDHAIRACNSALQMMQNLKILRADWVSRGLPFVDIGIGLNTGDMSVGNMGSTQIFDYTVMGDSVNLGSRLEGINKEYGTNIIISEFTYADVKDFYVVRELDWVKVKGKNLPVKIYELICNIGNVHPWTTNGFLNEFNHGFKFYHEQNWDAALDAFNKCHSIDENEKTVKLYIERCTLLKATPPNQDWDGVITMKTK